MLPRNAVNAPVLGAIRSGGLDAGWGLSGSRSQKSGSGRKTVAWQDNSGPFRKACPALDGDGFGREAGYFLGGLATCFRIGGENVIDGRERGARTASEYGFDDLRNAEEWEAVFEERGHSDFIGGIEGAGKCPALLQRFARKTQARETSRGSFFEVQAAEFRPIEGHLVRPHTGRKRERVLNGHAHIGGSELSENGAVDEFDEGMDGGLRMDDDVDLIGAHSEQPAGFDDLETFVHHGGGIDGDAVAHLPVRMRKGLFCRDARELREGRFAERAAGRGEDQAANFVVL